MQLLRFTVLGGSANLLYAVLFAALHRLGPQPANLMGAIASTVAANELHRRVTFRAGDRVRWFTAQWQGSGLAIAGMLAASLALAQLDADSQPDSWTREAALIGIVTGLVGLARFAALRWAFRPAATTEPTGQHRG